MSLALFDLTGKTCVVTGAGRGLGRAIAKGLAEAGARLAICGRTEADLVAVVAEIRAAGGEAEAYVFDAVDRAGCDRMFDAIADRFGRLDAVVVNHGVARARPAEHIEPADWDETIAVNLTGCFNCAQLAGRRMLAQGGGGSIILISSTGSLVGFRNLLSYGASKGGVDQICRQLAVEWGDRGIRVNAINPGYMTTYMRGTAARHQDPALEAEVRRMTPLARRGAPEELVGPVIFLASDASSYVTGHILPVDGGYVAM